MNITKWLSGLLLVIVPVAPDPLHLRDIDKDSLGNIVFSSILYRHGDRTPVKPYPNDPYKDEAEWPVPFGHLTEIGINQHLKLGRWLRSRYKNFLPETYSFYDFYIRSSDYDRTLMSAQANLANFYPLDDEQLGRSNLKFTPIPIHTIPRNSDPYISGHNECPRYVYEFNKLIKSRKYVKINQKYASLYDYINKHAGTKITSLHDTDLDTVHDALVVQEYHNKTLPAWTKEIYPDKLVPLAVIFTSIKAETRILQRLAIGALIGEMVNNMVMKSHCSLSPDRKIWMYSGHDTTIISLLMALNVYNMRLPPYTATVLVELWKNSKNQYSVTVSYKNTTDEPMILKLPGCSAACPLDHFVKLTKDLIPTDIREECLMKSHSNNLDYRVDVILVLVILVMTIQIFSLIYIYLRYIRSKNRKIMKNPLKRVN